MKKVGEQIRAEIVRTETEEKKLVAELQKTIIIDQVGRRYHPNAKEQEKKFALIKNLVLGNERETREVDLVKELFGHLQAVQIEEDFYRKSRGEPTREIDIHPTARAWLFEELVRRETGFKSPLAEEWLALAHNPKRFGLERLLRIIRNPDLVDIEVTETGDLVIRKIGEAKLGLLNRHAFNQMEKKGFWEGLVRIVEFLGPVSNLADYGLVEIAKRKGKGKISISPDFKQVIFVPANRDTDNLFSLVKKKDPRAKDDEAGDLAESEVKEFVNLLGNKKLIEIKKSIFSTYDIVAMAKVLLARIPQPKIASDLTL